MELRFSTKAVEDDGKVYKIADVPNTIENQTFEKEDEKLSLAHMHANTDRKEICTAPCWDSCKNLMSAGGLYTNRDIGICNIAKGKKKRPLTMMYKSALFKILTGSIQKICCMVMKSYVFVQPWSYVLVDGPREIVLTMEGSTSIEVNPQIVAMTAAKSLRAANCCSLEGLPTALRPDCTPGVDIELYVPLESSSSTPLTALSRRTRPMAAKTALLVPSAEVVGTE
jgi:hypothetical protein